MGIRLFAPETEVSDAAPAVSEALARISLETEAGRFDQALRWADRINRLSPETPIINEILGRLYFRLGEPKRALKHLKLATSRRNDPSLQAVIIDALFNLKRQREGFSHLEVALGNFAVSPGDELALCARRHTLSSTSPAPGWVAIGPDLHVHGEIKGCLESGVRLLTHEFKSLPTLLTPLSSAADTGWSFSARIPNGYRGALGATADRAALVGSDALFPPDFCLDGRAWIEENTLTGWVRAGWRPAMDLKLALTRNGKVLHRFESGRATPPDGRHLITLDLNSLDVGDEPLFVAAEVAPGALESLADSPAFPRLPPPPMGSGCRPSQKIDRRRAPKVDVLIPVYRGREEVIACIRSVQRFRDGVCDIIVVDDASPEPELSKALQTMASAGEIVLLANPENLGFPGSVNRGFAACSDRDIVILNADTEVFDGWLKRLRRAAYCASDIGTVTPLTNSGAIVSYPKGDGVPCSAETGARIAAIAAEVNDRDVIEAPTGVGFCMYIRQDCRASTGPLESILFGRGYGEENDFCLRASELGWKHMVAADVYIRHLEGQSFGDTRSALMERNGRLLEARYPGYDARIAEFSAQDPLRLARRRIDERRLSSCDDQYVLLLGFLDLGGVGQSIKRHAEKLTREGLTPLILQPKDGGTRLELVTPNSSLVDLQYDSESEAAELLKVLEALPIRKIELHHFLDLPADVVDAVVQQAKSLTVHLHDYSWVCPRISLLGGAGRYCEEPDIATCDKCIASNGAQISDLSTEALRQRSAGWLHRADRLIAPTLDVSSRFSRYFPKLSIAIEPLEHEQFEPALPIDWAQDRPLKIALIGAIGEQKGFSLLKACAEDALQRSLPLEFIVIGFTKDDLALKGLPNVFVVGKYHNRELGELIGREDPDIAFFASVTPETWCYALTQAMRSKLPIAAFDFGAISERLRSTNTLFTLIPPLASCSEVNDQLITLAGGSPPKPLPAKNRPATGPIFADASPRAFAVESRGAQVSFSEGAGNEAMSDSTRSLKATVQLLSLKMGLYQFSVTSNKASRRTARTDPIFPAIQISIAPGIPPESVEYMTGLKTEGAWLFDSKDLLIAKVRRGDTPVLITSYRSDGMEPLALKVERMDVETDGGSTPAPALPLRQPRAALPAPAIMGGEGPSERRTEDGRKVLPVKILAHISRRGDLAFVNQVWAGVLDQKLPIEGFSIEPLSGLAAQDVEYKGLTEKGVETPWIAGGAFCGTRQLNLALIGFSVRVRGEKTGSFECRYRGSFRSGAIVGPVRDGAPLRGSSLEDHLVGIELFIIENRSAAKPVQDGNPPTPSKPVLGRNRKSVGPRFSVFREDGG